MPSTPSIVTWLDLGEGLGGWLAPNHRQNTELQRIGCWKLRQAMDLSTKHSVTRSSSFSTAGKLSQISDFKIWISCWKHENWRKKIGKSTIESWTNLEENQPGAVALPADWQIHGMRMHVWHLVITFDIYSRARRKKTIAHPSPFTFVFFFPHQKHDLTFLK